MKSHEPANPRQLEQDNRNIENLLGLGFLGGRSRSRRGVTGGRGRGLLAFSGGFARRVRL